MNLTDFEVSNNFGVFLEEVLQILLKIDVTNFSGGKLKRCNSQRENSTSD